MMTTAIRTTICMTEQRFTCWDRSVRVRRGIDHNMLTLARKRAVLRKLVAITNRRGRDLDAKNQQHKYHQPPGCTQTAENA